MQNEQPKAPMTAEDLFHKYFRKALGKVWLNDFDKSLQEYAAQEVARAVAEKDAEINRLNEDLEIRKDVLSEMKSLTELLVEKISVLEQAAEKMAEVVSDQILFLQANNIGHEALLKMALADWNAAKEGGSNDTN